MNRRGFFGLIAGAVTAACVPWAAKPRVRMTHGANPNIGRIVAEAWEAHIKASHGAIERATFSFWRNQHASTGLDSLRANMRDLYEDCRS